MPGDSAVPGDADSAQIAIVDVYRWSAEE